MNRHRDPIPAGEFIMRFASKMSQEAFLLKRYYGDSLERLIQKTHDCLAYFSSFDKAVMVKILASQQSQQHKLVLIYRELNRITRKTFSYLRKEEICRLQFDILMWQPFSGLTFN